MTDAADRYRAHLAGGELVEFALTPLDRTDVPVLTAVRFAEGEPTGMGVGYGATDEAAALSALGETLETLQAARVIPTLPRVRGAHRDLHDRGAVDPVSLVLPAGSPYESARELEWVPARRWRTGEEVLLPVEAVATEPAELGPTAPEPLFTPLTNGLGAGDTVERALLHGLLELVQRDGNSAGFRALDRGLAADDAPLHDPLLRHLRDDLGIDAVVKTAYSDLGIANVFVAGCERDVDDAPFPLAVTGCGEAAHPDRAQAIRKAAHEFCASRARKRFGHAPLEDIERWLPERYLAYARAADPAGSEPRALEAWAEWLALDAGALRDRIADPVLAVRETVALDALPTTEVGDGVEEVLAVVLDRLAAFDVLWVDLSPPDGSLAVVKAIVPGLELETGSYARCGARNLARLLERDLGLVGLGAPPEGAAPLLLGPGHEPAWLSLARLDEVVGELYPLYREPARHVAAKLLASR